MGKNLSKKVLTGVLAGGLTISTALDTIVNKFFPNAQKYSSAWAQTADPADYDISGFFGDVFTKEGLPGKVVLYNLSGTPIDSTETSDGNVSFKKTSVNVPEIMVPEDFQMGQNYPNPFNPTTNIPFDVEKYAKVSFRVIDVSGRTVAQFNKELNPGNYKLNWDPKPNMPNGMYGLMAKIGDHDYFIKMTYLKHGGGSSGGGLTLSGGPGVEDKDAVKPINVGLLKSTDTGMYYVKFIPEADSLCSFTTDQFEYNGTPVTLDTVLTFENDEIGDTGYHRLDFLNALSPVGNTSWNDYPIPVFIPDHPFDQAVVDSLKYRLDRRNHMVQEKGFNGPMFVYEGVNSNPDVGIAVEWDENSPLDNSYVDTWGSNGPAHGTIKLNPNGGPEVTASAFDHGMGHAKSTYAHPNETIPALVGYTVMDSYTPRFTEDDAINDGIIDTLPNATRWEKYSDRRN